LTKLVVTHPLPMRVMAAKCQWTSAQIYIDESHGCKMSMDLSTNLHRG